MKFLRGETAAPVFWYLAFTIGVPLAGGRKLEGPFLGHSATIVLVVAVLTAARWVLGRWPS